MTTVAGAHELTLKGPEPRQTANGALSHSPYRFEANSGGRRNTATAKVDLTALCANLGIQTDTSATPLLREFVVHHHLNIEWYQARISSEQRRQRLFFAITVALLFVIPLACYWIPSNSGAAASVVAAQITAVLAGVIGFQNAMRGYLERRGYVTIFHQAASKLKKAVYLFEQRWGGCVPPGDRPEYELFLNNLRDAIRQARNVEDEEESAFFAAQAALPVVDLRSTLIEASQASATFIGGQAARGVSSPRSDQLSAARSAVDSLRSKLIALKANAFASPRDDQRALLEQSIASTQQQLRQAEQTLMQLTIRSTDGIA